MWSRPARSMVYRQLVNSNAINSMQHHLDLDPTSANFGDVASRHFYHYTVDSGFTFFFVRMNLVIRDASVNPSDFGGINELDNGILLDITDTDGETSLLDCTGGEPFKFNADWSRLVGVDSEIEKATGGNDETWISRWTVAKAGAMIEMKPGQRVQITHQDSLGGLVSFQVQVQGFTLKL